MSRYRGPRVKLMRALGVELPGLSRKSTERKPYPPGQHGQGKRRKLSEYGRQLAEKQKLRFNYGVGERQLRRLMQDAFRSRDVNGLKLLELLERRLDNAVFRSGMAPTIPAARQLINHGHILVNGKKVKTASYRISAGEEIQPKEKSKSLPVVAASLEAPSIVIPEWLEVDSKKGVSVVKSLPTKDSVPFPVEENLVVEFYSRRLSK